MLEQRGHGVGGLGHVGVRQDGERPVRRVAHQPDVRVQDHAEGALGAGQEAVEAPAALGQQVLHRVAGHLAAEAAELGAHGAELGVDEVGERRGRAPRRVRPYDAPVGQQHGEALDVVDRAAVAERAGAAGVVADHPADGAPGVGRGVGPEPQPERQRLALQRGVDGAGLHVGHPGLAVDAEHAVEVAGGVEHDAGPDRVAGDRGAGPAHRQGYAVLPRDRQRGHDLVGVAGADDHPRRDPVEAGVAGVERAGQRGVVGVADPGGLQREEEVAGRHVPDLLTRGHADPARPRGHQISRDPRRIAAASSSVTSRGAVASSRCCLSVPSTRPSTSPSS